MTIKTFEGTIKFFYFLMNINKSIISNGMITNEP